MSIHCFSPNYSTARDRFRQAAAQLGWTVESFPVSANVIEVDAARLSSSADDSSPQDFGGHGSKGQRVSESTLTIDIACHRTPASDLALVLSSGVHGVEGFLGSAIQLAMLERWQRSQPAGINIILIHAINPYGFAALRRFDENNVDLNRNFLLPGQSFQGSPPGYGALDRLLNPNYPPTPFELFYLKAAMQVARFGMASLRQSIAAGQYDFPKGLFFGGHSASESQQILAREMPRLLDGMGDTVHLDFHTGLGKRAADKLLIDYQPTDQQRWRLIDWYGQHAFQTDDKTDVAYQCNGSFGNWCVSQNLTPQYLYACAEFGTYPPLKVLAGLRAENQAHHFSLPNETVTKRAKRNLLELFCPASASWRSKVVNRSVQMIERAIQGLGAACR
jgi:predicted deacylase